MLIDSHAHLYWKEYDQDLDEVIQRSIKAGVTTIINVGVDIEKSQKALDQVLNTNWPDNLQVYSTIGIHPHEAIKYTPDGQTLYDHTKFVQKDMGSLEQVYKSDPKKVVALGECGLDYYFRELDPSVASLPQDDNKALQRQLFQAQIDLAKKLNLPLIVHCRDDRSQNPENSEAWNEVIEMTKDHFGIYHCYSGLEKTTERIIEETNFLISFAATITYPKNEYLREAVRIVPLELIVLETDCPFLPPQPKRGQRNEPANILEIAQLIAELKGISLKEIETQTTENVKKLLKLN